MPRSDTRQVTKKQSLFMTRKHEMQNGMDCKTMDFKGYFFIKGREFGSK
jgi:hypothetical protein